MLGESCSQSAFAARSLRVEKPTRCFIEPKNLTHEIWNFTAGDSQGRAGCPGSCGGTAKTQGSTRKTPESARAQ